MTELEESCHCEIFPVISIDYADDSTCNDIIIGYTHFVEVTHICV
jgi:hypothetical protein